VVTTEREASEIVQKSFDTLDRLDARKQYVAPEEDALSAWESAKPRSHTAKAAIDPKIKAYIREQVGALISTIAESVLFERQRQHQQLDKLRAEIEQLRTTVTRSKIVNVRIKDK
jgi:hypothetical protein